MPASERKRELRTFLIARRNARAPESLGIARGSRRLVPGLRREELAEVAGVGLTWYTWLEQGRDIRVSANVLERVARALDLSPSDRIYLFALCELPDPDPGSATASCVIPQPVLDALRSFRGPALVLGPAQDVLAANAFAEALYDFDGFRGEFGRNLIARALLDPARRDFYVDFDAGLRNSIAMLRLTHARHRGDERFEGLVRHLSANSPEFVRIWTEQETTLPATIPLRIWSSVFGRLDFNSVRFGIPELADHLVVLLSPVDDATRERIARWESGATVGG
ncbi:MAG: helix-turn-helix transcriptional regulator [Gemmatimonadaceae bacterium]